MDEYDIFLTLKFNKFISSKLTRQHDTRHKIYRSYIGKINDLIYGRRDTAAGNGILIEAVQHKGELGENAHLHARLKTPEFLDAEDMCVLLNTVWKTKFYEQAAGVKFNHITQIKNTDAVRNYTTRHGRLEVDLALSNFKKSTVKDTAKAQQRINRFLAQAHISKTYEQAKFYYKMHEAQAQIS